MYPTVYVALFGWLIVAFALFRTRPFRQAVIWATLLPFLFLPTTTIEFSGVPNYGRSTAIGYGLLIGLLVSRGVSIRDFRPRPMDIPIVLYCTAPMFASLTNGLGVYDGLSAMFPDVLTWGVPYLVGRIAFRDGMPVDLVRGLLIAGLVYVPLCLIEVRLSPQLSNWIYGFFPHSFGQQIRYDGFRPVVFLSHGLEVAFWMATWTLTCAWLWVRGRERYLGPVPYWLAFLLLLVTTLLCKSVGSVVLLAGGLMVMLVATRPATLAGLLRIALLTPVVFLGVRIAGMVDVWAIADFVDRLDPRSGESLSFRFRNEDMLLAKAMERPLFGWGGWGRNRVYDDSGRDLTTTDGLWIINLGTVGFFGMVSWLLTILWPCWAALRHRFSRRVRADLDLATAALAALIFLQFFVFVYSIPNVAGGPLPMLCLGAIGSAAYAAKRQHGRAAASGEASAGPVRGEREARFGWVR